MPLTATSLCASEQVSGLIVVLHGYGGTGQGLIPIAPQLRFPDYQFLFVDAPFPWGGSGKMWYDLETNDPQRLAHSRTLLNQWLRELPSQTNISLAKTFLLGFSQGAAMTLEVGLSLPLGGLISLSGYWHGQPRPGVAEFPAVLIVHGRLDQVVPLAAAGEIRQVLDEWGVFYQYEELAIGHEITPEVLDLVHNFIVNCTQSKG